MDNTVRILLADDHPVFRQGLRQIIKKNKNYQVVDEAASGDDALEKFRTLKPDILILDIDMPGLNGLQVAEIAQRESLPGRIIILTLYKEEDMFCNAVDYGIYGYVLKESAVTDIIDCIESVARGRYYISPEISGYLVKHSDKKRRFDEQHPAINNLTPMERNILELIAQMKTSKDIANVLSISHRTVENHRMNICNKLDIHGSHGLLKFALENKPFLS
jgi:DNA-binding NarL/FixJ family response regulator